MSMESVFGPVPTAKSGKCVFGQGDCGPKVNNVAQTFNDTLTENIKRTLISKSVSMGAVMAAEQTIDFSGADLTLCDNVRISGINQRAVVNYNFDMLDKAIDESEFRSMVKNNVERTLDQKTDAKNEVLSGDNSGTVNNIEQTYNRAVDRIVDSVDYSDFKSVMAEMRSRQTINFSGVKLAGKNCDISNLNQDVMMEYAAKLIADKVTREFTDIAKENATLSDVKSDSSFAASGLVGDLGRGVAGIAGTVLTGMGNIFSTLTQPFILLGIVIIVAILAYVIYRALMSGKAEGLIDDKGAQFQAEGGPQDAPQGMPPYGDQGVPSYGNDPAYYDAPMNPDAQNGFVVDQALVSGEPHGTPPVDLTHSTQTDFDSEPYAQTTADSQSAPTDFDSEQSAQTDFDSEQSEQSNESYEQPPVNEQSSPGSLVSGVASEGYESAKGKMFEWIGNPTDMIKDKVSALNTRA